MTALTLWLAAILTGTMAVFTGLMVKHQIDRTARNIAIGFTAVCSVSTALSVVCALFG